MNIEKPYLKFLIIRTDRIGDVVLSTPLPGEIKRKFPQSYVAVLLTEYTKDIYLNNPYVDEIIIDDNKSWNLLKKLREIKFDIAMMLLPRENINWILFLSGIPYRTGVGHKFYQFITNTKSVYRRKYKPLRHETDYCLDMLRKFSIEPESLDSEIFLSDEEVEIKKDLREEWTKGGQVAVGINSTSGGSAPNMTPAKYRELVDRLLAIDKIKVVITDHKPPEELVNIPGVIYVKGGLRNTIVSIAALDILVSASTGPMHIAAGLKVKTISLFCPLPACSPELWNPKGNESHILLPEEGYCRNECPGDPKMCNFEGKGGIGPEIVLEEIKKRIEEI